MRCVHRAAHGIIPSIPSIDLRFSQGIYNAFGRRRALISDVPGYTFSRAASALAKDSTRAYLAFATGVPRITDLGFLPEESRTNRHPYSGDVSNVAGWSSVGATTAPSAVLGCDGVPLVEVTATTASHRVVTTGPGLTGLTAAATYCLTFDLAMGVGGRYGHIGSSNTTAASAVFDLQAGVVSGTLGANFANAFIEQGPGTGLWRCTLVVTAAGTVFGMLAGVSAGPTPTGVLPSGASGKIYVGAAMFELGPNPSTYIGTLAAPVTRPSDILTITGLTPMSAGTIYAMATSPLNMAPNPALASLNDGTSVNWIDLLCIGTRPGMGVRAAGVEQVFTASGATGTWLTGTSGKTAARFALNDCAVGFSNGNISVDNSASIPTYNSLRIGRSNGGAIWNNYIQTIEVDGPFANSQLLARLT